MKDKARKTINHYVKLEAAGKLDRDSMLEHLVLFYKWLMAGVCIIRDVESNLVPLRPNRPQRLLLAYMLSQAARDEPIRLIILKSRKVGVSTFVQALFYFLCQHLPNRLGITLAHEAQATREIFDIAKLIGENYELPSRPVKQEISFPAVRSRYYCYTAGGLAVGAGGTPNYLHQSEVSKWSSNGPETDYTATEAVPTVPGTIIVYESTARGREFFYKKFEDAVDPTNPYEPVFIAWYLDERCKAPIPLKEPFILDTREKVILKRAKEEWDIDLSFEYLQWRRNKIKAITGGLEIFEQEYPSTPEEAVRTTSGLIYPGAYKAIIDSLPIDVTALSSNEKVGGIDFGYYDATVIGEAAYYDQTLYIYNIYRRQEGYTSDHVEAISDGVLYYCDPTAVSTRKDLEKAAREQQKSARLIAAPRSKEPGERDFTSGEIRKVRTWIDTGRLRILRSCSEQFMIEASNYLWNPRSGLPDDTRTSEVGHYDVLDMIRYLIMGVSSRRVQTSQPARTNGARATSRRISLRRV